MSAAKPAVLVTRKLPAAVEDRLRRDYEARLNPDDRLYSQDELIEWRRHPGEHRRRRRVSFSCNPWTLGGWR